MARRPARQTVLRDYIRPTPLCRVVPLADYQAAEESPGVAYRIGERIVKLNNDLLHAFFGLPGQFRDNWAIMRDPKQRALLARSLVDDSLLTTRRRKALFSILFWATLILWGLVGLLIYFLDPPALGTYQSFYSLFFYSLATSIFLPTPFEILLQNGVDQIGVLWTVFVAAVAKTAGSWVVLMMGDKANAGIRDLLDRHATLDRMFQAMERFAQRFGYFAVFVLFAIPFMTDTAPLFILAVLNMRKSVFLAVTFVAIVVRSLLFIYAGSAFAHVLT